MGVKNIFKLLTFKVVTVAQKRWLLTRGSYYTTDLTLKFWKSVFVLEVLTKGGSTENFVNQADGKMLQFLSISHQEKNHRFLTQELKVSPSVSYSWSMMGRLVVHFMFFRNHFMMNQLQEFPMKTQRKKRRKKRQSSCPWMSSG